MTPEEQFRESARRHGGFTIQGDARSANREQASIVAAVRLLRETPDKGARYLSQLLDDVDLSVVVWAALYLLPMDERRALAALTNASRSGRQLHALNAEMVMKEWEAGRLKVE